MTRIDTSAETQPELSKDANAAPALIALDWGTTALRAYLLDANGAVLDTRASPAGIMNLPKPAAEAASTPYSKKPAAHGLPALRRFR